MLSTNQQIIASVNSYLNTVVLEREQEIKNMLACILSGQHAFFLGLPGVAKSYMIERFVACFDEDITYFNILMGATTVPEEIFGATDITRLLKDKVMVRNTDGFLPQAQIAFIDEVFKGNSAVLNTLLRILNERKYKDGNVEVDVPLISLFTASNEMPPAEDKSLRAFINRVICKMVVSPIQHKSSFIKMLEGASVTPPKVLTHKLIAQMQAEVEAITIDDDFYDKYFELRCELHAKLPKLHVSDRQFKAMIKFLKAQCYLMGGTSLSQDYLITLQDCLWEEPEQIKDIARILSGYLSPSVNRATNLYNECMALIDSANKATDHKDLVANYNALKERYKEIDNKIKDNPGSAPFLKEITDKLKPSMDSLKKRVLAGV